MPTIEEEGCDHAKISSTSEYHVAHYAITHHPKSKMKLHICMRQKRSLFFPPCFLICILDERLHLCYRTGGGGAWGTYIRRQRGAGNTEATAQAWPCASCDSLAPTSLSSLRGTGSPSAVSQPGLRCRIFTACDRDRRYSEHRRGTRSAPPQTHLAQRPTALGREDARHRGHLTPLRGDP